MAEIRLPPVKAAPSVMPGEVDPVVPEVVDRVALPATGRDLTAAACAGGGRFQFYAVEPTVGRRAPNSVEVLTVRRVTGIVTAPGPALGDEASSRIARRALAENRGVAGLVLAEASRRAAAPSRLPRPRPSRPPSGPRAVRGS